MNDIEIRWHTVPDMTYQVIAWIDHGPSDLPVDPHPVAEVYIDGSRVSGSRPEEMSVEETRNRPEVAVRREAHRAVKRLLDVPRDDFDAETYRHLGMLIDDIHTFPQGSPVPPWMNAE